MNETHEPKLKEIASEPAKEIKTGENLSGLSSQLVKLTVEAELGAEMEKSSRLLAVFSSAVDTQIEFFVSCRLWRQN